MSLQSIVKLAYSLIQHLLRHGTGKVNDMIFLKNQLTEIIALLKNLINFMKSKINLPSQQ